MAFAAGTRGSPGIVMISPQIATINPAPADSRTSRIGTTWPDGAFNTAVPGGPMRYVVVAKRIDESTVQT